MNNVDQTGFTRPEIALTAALALSCAAATLLLFYLVPLVKHPHTAIWWRLLIALLVFIGVLIHELNAILRHGKPIQRAVIALAILLPLFVVMFAWLYLTLARSNPTAFSTPLTRTDALYFTMTVFSTVGFGDITPKSDPARVVTMLQMALDLILIAVVVRLLFDVASRATNRARSTDG
jgi:hypothetical protein